MGRAKLISSGNFGNKQLGFANLEQQSVSRFGLSGKSFGGAYLKNSHSKEKRPISTKRSMHLVIRSPLAKGERSLLKRDREIQSLIQNQGRKLGVKVYRIANGGNHLHLIVIPHSRRAFNQFIRAITGLIARLILGAERGSPLGKKFWEKRPFTRIVEWGRDYKGTCRYLLQNTLEALGFIPRQPRNYKLKPVPG